MPKYTLLKAPQPERRCGGDRASMWRSGPDELPQPWTVHAVDCYPGHTGSTVGHHPPTRNCAQLWHMGNELPEGAPDTVCSTVPLCGRMT